MKFRFCQHKNNLCSYIFFASSYVNRTTVSAVTALRFTIDDEHLIQWMQVKKIRKKCLVKMFLTEDKVLMG